MRKFFLYFSAALVLLIAIGIILFRGKYQIADTMTIPVEELSKTAYTDDPSDRSTRYGDYNGRILTLEKRDDTHFDFTFTAKDPKIASITFRDIDLSLFIPIVPLWAREDPELTVISLVDREWNRQQVSFSPGSKHLQVLGGDGFEGAELKWAELSRNCLNAGLWELLLFTEEEGEKTLYYQGWFRFPMGHYKRIFEQENAFSYWQHWYRLEHWYNPEGTLISLDNLRTVVEEQKAPFSYNPEEPLILAGEQVRKAKTFNRKGIHCFGDLCREETKNEFATFLPPGRYSVAKPWGDHLERISDPAEVLLRRVKSPADAKTLDEVEVVFNDPDTGESLRFIVSGIELDQLPKLAVGEYPKGLYMPMGIGVGPFYQTFDELKENPPYESPYFSVLLDGEGHWIDHHRLGVDGPVLHRDLNKAGVWHLYLLSYERHTLVAHYIIGE